MSEHAAEQDNTGYDDYCASYAEYISLLEKWPPAHRTLEQQKAIYHAEGVCGIKKMKAGVI